MKKFLSITIIIILFSACNREEINTLNPEPLVLSSQAKQLIGSDNEFGFDILKRIIPESENSENIMISPLSISLALAMTYNGANGQTKEEMRQTMHLDGLSNTEINTSYKNLISQMVQVDDQVTLTIANSIWYKNDFSVESDFIEVNENYYDARVEALDFTNSAATTIINNWVAENTNDKITEIVDQIDPAAVMFLINAIYFKGIWHYQFDESETYPQAFTKSDGTVIEPETMSLNADLNYLSTENFNFAELPYGKGNFSMIILVPSGNQSVDSVINTLDENSWNNYMNNMELTSTVNVFLPKFTFEYEELLNNTLQNLGMPTAFHEDADFSNINPTANLFISKVKHKTFIEVNEEGTEAAAVTSVQMNETSVGPPAGPVVRADRPFVFIIRETTSGSIIFSGKIENPNYN
ncbi:MAG: serpin family protein [Bacteroidota bacterium]|nr:serpin family protein [Bacteroidota bacterium]